MNNITIHSNEIDPMRERVTNESQKLVELGTTAPFMMWDYTCFDKNNKNNKNSKSLNLVYARYTGGELDGKEEIFIDDFSDKRRYYDKYDKEVESIGSMLNRIDDEHPEYAVYRLGDDGPHRTKRPGVDRHFPYGLRRFDNAMDAFNVMCGEYGPVTEGLGMGEVHIMTADDWQRVVFDRFCDLCVRYNSGDEKAVDTYNNMENGGEYMTDFFIDFNHIMYDGKYFWTALMGMKDDNVTRPCRAQWDLIEELWYGYDIEGMWKCAKYIMKDVTDFDEMNNILIDRGMMAYCIGGEFLERMLDIMEEAGMIDDDDFDEEENSPAGEGI